MSQNLGGRLPLAAPAQLSPAQRSFYDDVIKVRVPLADAGGYRLTDDEGHLIGPFNPYLAQTDVAAAQFLLGEAVSHAGLSLILREAVVLTIAAQWDSAYIRYAHIASGQAAGLTRAQVDALLRGEVPDTLDVDVRLAAQLTRELLDGHRLSQQLYEAASAAFGTAGLVAISALIGQYTTTATVLAVFDVPAPAD